MKALNNGSMLVAATMWLLASIAHAIPCTNDIALPWPETFPGSGNFQCNGDAACLALVEQANCIALKDAQGTPKNCSSAGNAKRQTGTLDCATNELCIVYTDTVVLTLLCLNPANGDYHDTSGGRGNAISRVYTAADGAVATYTGDVTPTLKSQGIEIRTTVVSLAGSMTTVTTTVTSVMSAGIGSGAVPAAQGSVAAGSPGVYGGYSSSGAVPAAQSPAAAGSATAAAGSTTAAAGSTTAAPSPANVAGAMGARSSASVVVQSSATAASSRSNSSMASSGAESAGIAVQTGGAIVNKLANGALGLVAGLPLLVAAL